MIKYMAKLLVNWTFSSDLIECPNFVVENIKKYQTEFDKWLYNTKEHDYWVNIDDEQIIQFDIDAFVNWINEYLINNLDDKAFILKHDFKPNKEEKLLPQINF